jgi:chemotaxis protein MotB
VSKQKKHEEEEHPDETWLVPYSDVLTLLLALFIVLFAVSKVDTQKFTAMADSFTTIFNEASGFLPASNAMIGQPTSAPKAESAAGSGQDKLDDQRMNAALNSFIESNRLQDMVAVNPTASGFTVRVLDSVMFLPGSDRLLPNAYPVLDKIAELASRAPYNINVEGYTDDHPSASAMGNWQLSSNRALAVLSYMQGKGVDPRKLSAAGFGEYHPVLPNITERNRAINRRVEINFISPEYYEQTHYSEMQ